MPRGTKTGARRLAIEWNEHDQHFNEAIVAKHWEDVDFHAVMCDAIIQRVRRMRPHVVDEFYANVGVGTESAPISRRAAQKLARQSEWDEYLDAHHRHEEATCHYR